VLKLRRLDRINDLKDKVMEDYPQISYPDSLHPHSNENPLSMKVISSHAGPGAWNQGDPLSPFRFVIKLDLANHSSKPLILKSFGISSLEASHERLNQSQPQGKLLFIENRNKIPINIFPCQIAGDYFGLIEYQITIPLDDRERLNFVSDSEAFQNYKIELSYEYHGVDRTPYSASILVQDTFQEFKSVWLEQWNGHQHILLRRGIIDSIGGGLKS